MAEVITEDHLALACRMLKGSSIRLLEQVLIRTDQSTHVKGATNWHIDFAFYPRHRTAVPRQTYYHMVHHLSPVHSGCGGTMIVPKSHHATYAAAASLLVDGEDSRFDDQPAFNAEILRLADVDTSKAIEVLPQEGDLVLFDPMCLHSGSHNASGNPRYVLFMSFFDASATELIRKLDQMKYRDGFPESLREGLRPELHTLLHHS